MLADMGALQKLAFSALPVLMDAAVKGLAILAVTGVLMIIMRKASAATKQMVWLAALALLLALPLASAALPSWQVLPGWAKIEMPAESTEQKPADVTDSIGGANEIDDGIVEEPRPEAPYAPAEYAADPVDYTPRSDDIAHAPAAAVQPEHPVEDADAAAPHAPAAETNRPWRSLLVPAAVCLWLAGTLVCLLPILLGRMSLLRLARRSRRIIGGSWATLAKRASDAIGLQHEAIILQSDDEPMPMVWGTFRPKLLLPAQAESWSADRRWVVLLHELAHAKRRDCLWKLIAHVACSFYWFNPLCWLAFKLMQREAEAACDDLVLSRGTAVSPVRPSDYATHLLEIASGLKSGMLAAYSSIALARRSRLEGRLLAILDNNRNRRALTRIGIIVLAAAAAAIAIPLACMKPAEPKTSLQEAQRQVIALKVLLKDAPVTTDIKSLEIFEKTPGMAGEYRIRKDVQRRELPIATEEKPFINSGIFYLPEKNVYYIQYDDAGASTLHYYGPFEGDPDKLDLEAAAKLTPAGAAETDNYDRFVFVRMDTENGKQVRRLVLAKALSEGFDKKDICVCSDEIPLCAANGTLYTLSYETLYAVDIATGRRDVVDDGVRAWDFHDGKLYAAGKQDGQILIYDFERRARKIVNLQGFRPSGLIAVSPDGRHIATFARLKLEGTDLLSPQLTQIRTLQILDTETWKVSEPCKAVTIPGSLTDNNPSMKPAWLDNKTILFQHAGIVETIPDENTIEKPSDIRVPTDLFAATADIESGRIRNFADNAAFTLDFDRPDAAGDLIVILNNYTTGARRCRVDAEAGKFIDADSKIGEFSIGGGGVFKDCDVQFAMSLHHGKRLLENHENGITVKVSPDGGRIIWRRSEPGSEHRSSGRYEVCYYDSTEKQVRVVSGGWSVEPFLWLTEKDLTETAPAKFSEGWQPIVAAAPAAQTAETTFADEFADRFIELLRSRKLKFMNEQVMQAEHKDMRDFIAGLGLSPSESPRQAILKSLANYVPQYFTNDEQTYLTYRDRVNTLKVKLWRALSATAPIGEIMRRRNEQLQWMRDIIDGTPENETALKAMQLKPGELLDKALSDLQKYADDPLNPLWHTMSDAEFQEFQDGIIKFIAKMSNNGQPFDRPDSVAFHCMTTAWMVQSPSHIDPANPSRAIYEAPLPFDDKQTGCGASGSYLNMRFASNEAFAGKEIQLDTTHTHGLPRNAVNVVDDARLNFPVELGTKPINDPQRQEWIQQHKMDLALDMIGKNLVALRGGQLVQLNVTNWQSADATDDARLTNLIQSKGSEEFSIAALPLWPYNSRNPEPVVFVAMRTAEGRLAVFRIVYRQQHPNDPTDGTVCIHYRLRPAADNPSAAQSEKASEALQAKIADLIVQLGSEEAGDREKAQQALIKVGKQALPLLQAAMSDKNVERATRAKAVFEKLAVPTLTLTGENTELLPYEPLRITVRLRNDSDISIPRPRGLILNSHGTVRFLVRKDQEEDFRPLYDHFSNWPHADGIGASEMKAGAEESYQDTLSHGWESDKKQSPQYLLPEPGQYQLKAVVVYNGKPFVESAAIDLTVKEPLGADVDALALIRKHAESKEFFNGSYLHISLGDKWQEPVAVMQELVQKHPQSRYAMYASYILARYYRKNQGGTPAESMEMLEKVLGYTESFLTEQVLAELVLRHSELGQFDEAQRFLTKLEKMYPGSESLHIAQCDFQRFKQNYVSNPTEGDTATRPDTDGDAAGWGAPGTNGLRIRLVLDSSDGDTPALTADNVAAAVELWNTSDKPIKIAEQNTTGGREMINDEWLIGLQMQVTDSDRRARIFFRADNQDQYWTSIEKFIGAAKEIPAGEKALFKIRLHRLVDSEGTNLLSLRGDHQLQPVLNVHGQGGNLWHGSAVGKPVQVRIAATQPAGAFDSFTVRIGTTNPKDATITFKADGTYSYKLVRGEQTGYTTDYRLKKEYTEELVRLLAGTEWLSRDGKVKRDLKDGEKFYLSVTRDGVETKTQCYGPQDEAYSELIQFIRLTSRQEMMLWRMKSGWEDGGVFVHNLNGELAGFLGEGSGTSREPLPDYTRFLDTLDAMAGTGNQEQQKLARRVAEMIRKYSAMQLKKLPGSELSFDEAIKGGFAFVAVCESMDEVNIEDSDTGVHEYGTSYQKLHVVEVLAGQEPAGGVRGFHYSVLKPYDAADDASGLDERDIRKGERVIWIVRKVGDRFRGIKAMADTPANRATAKRLAAAIPDTQPDTEDDAFTLDLYSATMGDICAFLRQKYSVRLCMEDIDFDRKKDGVTVQQAIDQLEAIAAERELSELETMRLKLARQYISEGKPASMLFDVGQRYSGTFKAASLDALLTKLTDGTPYKWQKVEDTFVVLPKAGSRLAYKVTLATEGMTVEQAVGKVIEQRPAGSNIGLTVTMGMPVREGEDPMPWLNAHVPPMELENVTAMEALCRITAGARPDSVWALAGYKEGRSLAILKGPNTQPMDKEQMRQAKQQAEDFIALLKKEEYDSAAKLLDPENPIVATDDPEKRLEQFWQGFKRGCGAQVHPSGESQVFYEGTRIVVLWPHKGRTAECYFTASFDDLDKGIISIEWRKKIFVPPVNGSRLELRIAPYCTDMNNEQFAFYMKLLKEGKIGFWWNGKGPITITGAIPDHAWLPAAGDVSDALITGEYDGQKYILVSDKPGETMLTGEGTDAWGLKKVYITQDANGRPAVGIDMDERGAELLAALTEANQEKALAMLIDGRVVSAPVIMAKISTKCLIVGDFSEQEVEAMAAALKKGMALRKAAATQPTNKLKATLPSGAEIELVAVSCYPDKDKPFWRPDGTPLVEPLFDTTDSDVTSFNDPNWRKFELVFRLGGKAAEPGYESQIWRTDDGGNWWAGRRSKSGRFIPDLKVIGVSMPADMQTFSMDFSVAAGPWETVASSDGKEAKGPIGIAFEDVESSSRGPSARIRAKYNPDTHEARLIARDADGGEHIVRGFDTRRGDDAGADFLFAGLAPDQIRSYTLQTRPLETVSLKNISLAPGTMSDASLIPTAIQSEEDEAAVRQVAEKFLAALRNRDIESLKSLSLGSVYGWDNSERSDLPIYWWLDGMGVRRLEETVGKMHDETYKDNPDLMSKIEQLAVNGKCAAVKLLIPGEKENYTLLFFIKTEAGWRFVTISEDKEPLAETLALRVKRLKHIIPTPGTKFVTNADKAPWSAPVNGLRCRLLVRYPAKDPDAQHLVLELRNDNENPIYIPMFHDELPILEFSIKDHPELLSPTSYGCAIPMPYLLKPGEILRRQLTRNALTGSSACYAVGYGWSEQGKGWVRFKPDKSEYEVSAVMKWDNAELPLQPTSPIKVKMWTGSLTTNTVQYRLGAKKSSAEPSATQPAKKPDMKQRQEMLIKAVNAKTFDRNAAGAALEDVGNAYLFFTKGPFDSLPDKSELPQGIGVQRRDGNYYLAMADGLNRTQRGPAPDEWLDRLAAARKDGFKLQNVKFVAALTEEIRLKRDKLLGEADAKICEGLLKLAEDYPQLQETGQGRTLKEQLASSGQAGRISIWADRNQGSKAGSKKPVPPESRYGILVFIRPLHYYEKNEEQRQLGEFFLTEYDNLALMGQVGCSAGEAKLDAALKKLVSDALAPLKELNAKAGEGAAATQPAKPVEMSDKAQKLYDTTIANVERINILLSWHKGLAPDNSRRLNLLLHTTNQKENTNDWQVRIKLNDRQAKQLVELLARLGYFEKAREYTNAALDPMPAQTPGYLLHLGVMGEDGKCKLVMFEDPGGEDRVREVVAEMKKLLDDEQQKSIDRILEQLKPEKAPATRPASQADKPSPDQAAESACISEIRKVLPSGWSIKPGKSGEGYFEISPDRSFRVVYNSPLAMGPEEQEFRISVTVGPKLSQADYARLAEFNAKLEEKYKGNEATLNRLGKQPWWVRSSKAQERPYLLPTHFDDFSSLAIIAKPLSSARYEFKSKEDADEAARVFAAVAGKFKSYAEATTQPDSRDPAELVKSIPVLTESSEGIKSLDISATFKIDPVRMKVRIICDGPKLRSLWITDPSTETPVAICAGDEIFLYDLIHKSALTLQNTELPWMQLQQLEDVCYCNFGTTKRPEECKSPVFIDIASILSMKGNKLTATRRADGLEVIEAVSEQGNTARVILDTKAAYPCRQFELIAKDEKTPMLLVTFDVNKPIEKWLSMPDLKALTAKIDLKELKGKEGTALEYLRDFLKILQSSLMARVALTSPEIRKEFEKFVGEKIDWVAVAEYDKKVTAAFREIVPELKPTEETSATKPDETDAGAWGETVDDLQVSISIDGEIFDANEEIPLRWRIRNAGSTDRVILWHQLHYSPALFDIVDSDGKAYPNRSDERRAFNDARPARPVTITLKPGEVKEATFDLSKFIGQLSGELKITGVYSPKDADIPKEYLEDEKFADAAMARVASKEIALTIYRHTATGRFETDKNISVAAEIWNKTTNLAKAKTLRFENKDGRLTAKLNAYFLSAPKNTYIAGVELHDKEGKLLAVNYVFFESSGNINTIRGIAIAAWETNTLQFDFGKAADLDGAASFRLSLMCQGKEMAGIMRKMRVVDDVEAALNETMKERGLVVQEVKKHSYPFRHEKGDGTAYFIGKPLGEIDRDRISYTYVVWVMPTDYAGAMDTSDTAPQIGPARLVGTAANGKVYAWPGDERSLVAADAVMPLPKEITEWRECTLATADRILRDGLLKLSEKYPQLKQTNHGQLADWLGRHQPNPGELRFAAGHYPAGRGKSDGDKEDVPKEQQYRFTVILKPVGGQVEQAVYDLKFKQLRLEGRISVSAGDEKLQQELQKLLNESLKPLENMESRLSACYGERPAKNEDANLIKGLSLAIKCEKPDMELAEDLTLSLTITNKSGRDVELDYWGLKADLPIVSLRMTNEAGKVFFLSTKQSAWCGTGVSGRKFESDKEVSGTIRLGDIWERGGRRPEIPSGKYKVVARIGLTDKNGGRVVSARSEPVTVTVSQWPWGPDNNGVRARLRPDVEKWAAGRMPAFKADIRNKGQGMYSVAQTQMLCQLVLDGKKYRWSGEIDVMSSPLPPGRQYDDIPVSLTDEWHTIEGNKAMELKPGRHTLQILFFTDGGSSHENLVVESNFVEFEIAAAEMSEKARGLYETAIAGTDKIAFWFLIWPKSDKPDTANRSYIILTTGPVEARKKKLQVKITEQQAKQLIETLAGLGYFEKATDYTKLDLEPQPFQPPAYQLYICVGPAGKATMMYQDLDGEDALRSIIAEIRKILTDEQNKIMDDIPQAARAAGPGEPAAAVDTKRFVELVQSMKSNWSDTSRMQAAQAELARMGRPAVPLLVDLLHGDSALPSTPGMVAEVLAEIGDTDAVEPLIVFMESNAQYESRAKAAEALGKLGDRRAVPALINQLGGYPYCIQQAAAKALGQLGDRRAVDALIAQLREHKYYAVRREIARALGLIRDEKAIGPLIEEIKLDKGDGVSPPEGYDSYCRDASVGALVRIGPACVKPAISALADPGPHDWYIIDTLKNVQGEGVIGPLLDALASPAAPVRAGAAAALGLRREKSAADPLAKLLNDSDESVKMQAAVALGRLKDGRSLTTLLDMLKNPSYQLRTLAATALQQLGDPSAAPALAEAMKATKDGEGGEAFAYAIGSLGNTDVVPALVEHLENKALPNRGNAAEALGLLADRRAAAALITALDDGEFDVKIRAAAALGKIGDPAAVPALIKTLALSDKDDWSYSIRAAAVVSLGQLGDARAIKPLENLYKKIWERAEPGLSGFSSPNIQISDLGRKIYEALSCIKAKNSSTPPATQPA